MEKDILKNNITLLRFMISVKDENNNCNVQKIYKSIDSNKSSMDIQNLINELAAQGYVHQTNLNNVHILPKGISEYGTLTSSFWSMYKKPISYIFTYIMGILSTIIVELIKLIFT